MEGENELKPDHDGEADWWEERIVEPELLVTAIVGDKTLNTAGSVVVNFVDGSICSNSELMREHKPLKMIERMGPEVREVLYSRQRKGTVEESW